MAKRSRTVVFLLRALIIVVLIMVILYHFVPSVEIWCNEQFRRQKPKLDHFSSFLKDGDFNVIPEHRSLGKTISEYYGDRTRVDQTEIDSRLQFYKQYHTGSVMSDGYSAWLPANSKWENGVIRFGPEVAEEIKRSSRPPTDPTNSNS